MERRRRALGLKKPGGNSEEKPQKTKRPVSDENSPSEKKSNRPKGKMSKTATVTPKHRTPRHQNNVTPLKEGSPCSPLQSPQYQMMFPTTLCSPEVEVSWDWSCSQAPKEMLPPKCVKRFNQVEPPSPINPTIAFCPRLPVYRQITEEENQERLAFYKNILSRSLKCSQNVSPNSKNNNTENMKCPGSTELMTTPKRSTKLVVDSEKYEGQMSSLFDDSANEFMLECSQAIEEKLRNGEIDMGPIVDISIPPKRHLSPKEERECLPKKMCHGKTKMNLFPEETKRLDLKPKADVLENQQLHVIPQNSRLKQLNNTQVDLDNPQQKSNSETYLKYCETESIKGAHSNLGVGSTNTEILKDNKQKGFIGKNKKQIKPIQSLVSNTKCQSTEKTYQTIQQLPINKGTVMPSTEIVQKNVNITTCDKVDKFRKPKNGNVLNRNCYSVTNTQNNNNNNVVNKLPESERAQNVRTIDCNNSREQGRTHINDVTSLLDDGLDSELSNLDVDSLCLNSKISQPESHSVTKSAPKMCTRQEIEAKRLAALKKLMMKKRR